MSLLCFALSLLTLLYIRFKEDPLRNSCPRALLQDKYRINTSRYTRSLFHDDSLSTIISSSLLNADVYTLLSMSDNQSVLQVLTDCVEVCCV